MVVRLHIQVRLLQAAAGRRELTLTLTLTRYAFYKKQLGGEKAVVLGASLGGAVWRPASNPCAPPRSPSPSPPRWRSPSPSSPRLLALALALALISRKAPNATPAAPSVTPPRLAGRPMRNPSTSRQVALDFAATHPECVEALILMDAGGESYAQPDPLTLP